jgi:hypothetical protein
MNDLRIHDLRQSFASDALQLGEDLTIREDTFGAQRLGMDSERSPKAQHERFIALRACPMPFSWTSTASSAPISGGLFMQCSHGQLFQRRLEVCLGFRWRDVADGFAEAPVIGPVDPRRQSPRSVLS